MIGKNDSLKVRYWNDADTVNFQCEATDDRLVEFDLKLMQVESEHLEIPEQDYKVVARLPSLKFRKICRDLQEFGETITISGRKSGLHFMAQSEVGGGMFVLASRKGKATEKVDLTIHEPVTATFDLGCLMKFSKDPSH